MINESTEKALKIIAELIKGETIDEYNNNNLLEHYELNSEVSADVDQILSFFECSAYQGNLRGLYISPLIDNKYFGFTNDELKKELGADTNANLYINYFIMSTVISIFFKDDSNIHPIVDYISLHDVQEVVSKRIAILEESLDTSNITKEVLENEEGCRKLIDIWQNDLPYSTSKDVEKMISTKITGKSKLGIINKTLKFMENQSLLEYRSEVDAYFPTNRLTTIIYHAYKSSKYLSVLNELFIENTDIEVNGGEDATK